MNKKVQNYVVRFDPENEYGCITKKASSRKEAYQIYHELKDKLDSIRPGHLYILENYGDYQKYLCNYETGKSVNSVYIVNQLKDLTYHLVNDVYNQIYKLYQNSKTMIIFDKYPRSI